MTDHEKAKWDQTKGKLKEAEGKLTGDDTRERQGKAETKWSETKESAGEKWDEAKDKVS